MTDIDWRVQHHAAADALLGLADTLVPRNPADTMTVREVESLLRTTAELHQKEAGDGVRNPVIPATKSPITGRYTTQEEA